MFARLGAGGAVRSAMYLVAGLALAFSLVTAWGFVVSAQLATDFNVFWTMVRMPDPYAPTVWPFAYPPTTLIWLQPLKLLGSTVAFLIWGLISASLYVVAIRPSLGKQWPLALLAFPCVFALLTGQTTLIVAAMLFYAFRSNCAGIILGLAFTIKPQLVFLAPLSLFLLRDWRQIFWMAGTVALACGLATFLFGPQIWLDWVGSLGHLHRRAVEMHILRGAASPAAIAESYGFNPLPALFVGIVLGVSTLLFSFKQSEEKGALLALCCILSSPYALLYDLAAVMPLAVPHLLRMNWRTVPALMVVSVPFQLAGVVGLAIGSITFSRKGSQPTHRQRLQTTEIRQAG